ncbi:stress-induced-phosphoprotein 1 [Agrilus planipennis]|uniref:Stress-induced-phosphoprotein 1 n=1 Tax=Agrilus planipennis TaxID=224129 RepID=A0A1W4WVR7_AGRPL|nr:stress-induced-phosphoprotein 1 [Agrilus planipennis]
MKEENHSQSAESYKEQGNAAIQRKAFEEAILHYTCAIKIDPQNSVLYSNRSFAFLKVQQYFLAMEDANEAIKLSPNWAKGYFRKAAIHHETEHYLQAIECYHKALEHAPNDQVIIEAIKTTAQKLHKDQKSDAQIPWVGAGVGIVVGVMVVIADYVYTNKPTLTHPILMAVMTIVIALIGYGVAKVCRYYIKCQRDSLLQPPIDLCPKEEYEKENLLENEHRNTPRYTKSQARQRYKKGKQ